jgi:hypothetical protein
MRHLADQSFPADLDSMSRFSAPIKRVTPPQLDRAEATRELVRLPEQAPRMALLRDSFRIDREDADALIELIINAPVEPPDQLTKAAVAVRNALKTARPVPFTYQVRLATDRAQLLVAALRLG